VLAFHGWMDNANTFDPLVKLLPAHLSILAIDLPGHGLSSRYPPGSVYHNTEDVIAIRRMVKQQNWNKKLVLMGHSLGSIYTFLYAAIFPDEVERYIGFDMIKPPNIKIDKLIGDTGNDIDKFLKFIANPDFSPEYPWAEMVDRLCKGSRMSVTKESAEILLQRGAYKSETRDRHFGFTRDIRQMFSFMAYLPFDHMIQLASNIKCEVLNIKFNKDAHFYEDKKYYTDILEIIRKNSKRLEYHEIDGSHHAHLNNPEKVASIVSKFIQS